MLLTLYLRQLPSRRLTSPKTWFENPCWQEAVRLGFHHSEHKISRILQAKRPAHAASVRCLAQKLMDAKESLRRPQERVVVE
jgi:hypothetical protein